MLEGSKNLVRWTQGLPPLPVFGAEADGGAFLMLSVLGILNMIAGLLVLLIFVVRTALEDRTLHKELDGYREYAQQVRYRLLPGIW